jgi:CHAD domain-containing protein
MSYRFERDDKLARALPRIARKQAKKAVQALHAHQRARDRVHDARTSVKKLRGLLRLLGPSLGDRYQRENDRLGHLGDQLSQLRDAEVMIETFDGLFHQFHDQLGPGLRRVRSRLTARLRSVERRLDLPDRLDRAARAFQKTRKRAKSWTPRTGGWDALADGLRDTYAWGRSAMATAYDRGKDADFHDWRKAVKYHGYHVRLLADLWPEEMNGRLEVLERLGTLLGEDHDLAVFAETLTSERDCFDNRRDQQVLLGLIAQRQQALRAMAHPLGRRLYAEAPAAFTRRLHRYWRIWRDRNDARETAVAQAAA